MEIKTQTKDERIAFHIRGIKIVLLPSLMGVLAGLLSFVLFYNDDPLRVFSIVILALAIYAQKYLFLPIGIDSKKFVFKDWFFVSFMTFCFWFITWTLLLNGTKPDFVPLL